MTIKSISVTSIFYILLPAKPDSLPKIDCEWSAWTIGQCSKSCGVGSKTKTRTKITVEAHGGSCTGTATGTEVCSNQNSCPGKS